MGIRTGLSKQPNMILEELSLRQDTKITRFTKKVYVLWQRQR